MDEEKERQEQELPDQLLNKAGNMIGSAGKRAGRAVGRRAKKEGLKILKELGKKVIALIMKNPKLALIILVVIIVAILIFGILLPALDSYLDDINAETTDEVTYQLVKEYCTIDEDGIRFDKEKFLENIVAELSLNGIDLNDLGFGDDGNYEIAVENTVTGETNIVHNTVKPNTQAAEYLFKFLTAALTGEFPYIEGSDEEVQGIIRVKRRKNENEEPKDLTYMGYKKFSEMLKTEDSNEKDEIQNYFSLDEDWNLCIAKPYKRTVNTYDHDNLINSEGEYTISEVKIPYRTMVSQYTTPFLFLIDLQIITHNPDYVTAVSELMSEQSEIEFTIFDQITESTHIYNYKATRHSWYPEEVETSGETVTGVSRTEWRVGESSVDDKKITTAETDSIKANITKAKTWIVEQETNYAMQEKKDHPYGQNGTTNTLRKQDEIINPPGSWDTERSEYFFTEIIKREWVKSGDTNTLIKPSEFMGLWSNKTGTYVKGAPYLPNGPDKPGKMVGYELLGSYQLDRPIINIITAREDLYELLERETTQTIGEILRECINFYLTGKELPENFASRFKTLFDTQEFIESNWNSIGSGFWWPMNDTSYTRITSPFGYRGNIGVTGASTYHKGIDIAAPIGAEVIASADGTVEVAGYSRSAGNWIRINHANGIKTVYMHNSELLVTVGQEVKQGDIIALSGNTGISGGPHLHFGVEVNGDYVDPLDYVDPENPRPINTVPDVPISVEAWRPYIAQAFSELGYTMTEEKVGALLRQIDTESHGDQSIMQGIVDSNSGAPIRIGDGTCPWCSSRAENTCGDTNIGHGLLQFIPTTFYSNMLPGHTNIFNGYDQICACISMLEKRTGPYTQYIGKGTGWG